MSEKNVINLGKKKSKFRKSLEMNPKSFQNEGNAMVAIYSFLSDLASFDRAISKFYLLAPEAERKVWLNEVQKYINSQGS